MATTENDLYTCSLVHFFCHFQNDLLSLQPLFFFFFLTFNYSPFGVLTVINCLSYILKLYISKDHGGRAVQ